MTDTDKLVDAFLRDREHGYAPLRAELRDLIEKVELGVWKLVHEPIEITPGADPKEVTLYQGHRYLVSMTMFPEPSKPIAIPCPENCGFLDYDGDKRDACACTDGYMTVNEFARYQWEQAIGVADGGQWQTRSGVVRELKEQLDRRFPKEEKP